MKKSNLRKYVCTEGVAVVLCMLASAACAQYSTEVLSHNPLVYYRLNDPTVSYPFADAATNSSSLGAAANGYYVGTITHPDTSSLIGGMTAETSIAGGIIEMPYLNNWASSNVFGAEMWFDVNPGDTGVLCCNVNMDGRWGWILYYGEDGVDIVSLRMYMGGGGGNATLVANPKSPVLAESVWHHVVTQTDGTNAWIYIDGTNAVEVAVPPGYAPPTTDHACPFQIFGRTDNNFKSTGLAAQVAIYTNVLTAGQILNHYNVGITAHPATNYSAVVLSDGALAYWALDDGAYTAPGSNPVAANSGTTGSDADGTYLAGTTPGAAGPPFAGMTGGGACHFNGLSQAFDGDTSGTLPGYIDISSSSGADGVNFGSNITMMAWFQRDAWVSDYQTIFGNGDGTWRMERYGGGDAVQFGLNPTTGSFFGIGSSITQIGDGAWHHIVGVYDGTNVSLYIDGKLDTKQPEAGLTISDTSSAASIGEDTGAVGRVWCGNIAEVAIFTNALTAAEVTSLYNAAQPSPQIMQPPIITPPIYEGEDITLAVVANGVLPLSYQWTSNSVAISGQTTTNLVLNGVHPNYDASYGVIVSNIYGVVTSSPTVLSVISGPPVILAQPSPAATTRYLNGSVTFSVNAVGAVPITYQWQYNASPISGATSSSLTLSGLASASAGTYNVVLNNPHGTLASSNEVLTVIPAPPNYPSAVMSLGPQAYWRLNETNGTTAYDYAGGYNGTIAGGVTVGKAGAGLPGLASSGSGSFYFDGSSGVVDTPFLVNGDQGTFVAMINTTNPTDLVGILDARGGPGSSCSLELYTDGLTLQYTWDNQADSYGFANAGGITATANTWCLAAVSVGETETIMYVDTGGGLQSETNEVPSIVVSNTGPLLIGRDTAWYYFPGGISEGAYFNRALTPAEIATLDNVMFSGAAVGAPDIIIPPASQLALTGSEASLTVRAIGTLPMSYQWQFDNSDIPGATSQTLVIPTVALTNAGSYTVIITNSVGSSNSIAAVLTVSNAPVSGNLTYGLVGHYKFDGDFTDSSGNGNNGTGLNSPQFVPGQFGSAVLLADTNAGFDQCVTLGYPPDMQFNYGDTFSVAWWVNYTTPCGDLPMIATAINSTYQPGWSFADSYDDDGGGNMEISFASSLGDFTAVGPYKINDGTWHHVAVTADLVNLLAQVYIDGTPVTNYFFNGSGSARTTLPIPPSTAPAVVYPGYPIMMGSDPTVGYAGGQRGTYAIDDMGIWNRLLAPTEVTSIYSAGTNGMPIGSGGTTTVEMTAKLTVSGQFQVSWSEGTLESAPALTGPWTPVVGATPPTYTVTPTGTQEYYRVH
jgi:hypothetical protein